MNKTNDQHSHGLLESLQALLWNKRVANVFRALLTPFLDPQRATTLQKRPWDTEEYRQPLLQPRAHYQ